MAFPRRFKSATWYMRLSTGEVELVTPTALQRAFKCGLVNARTPVREIGGHMWTTLGEAAEIADGPRGELSSLAPMAIDDANVVAADLENGLRWHVRQDADPRAFRASRLGVVGALLVATAAIGAVAVLGMQMPNNELREHVSAAREAQEAKAELEANALAIARKARPALDLIWPEEEPAERLSEDQKRRLIERDTAMLQHGVGLPTSHSLMAPKGAKDPFANSSKVPSHQNDPWDPLNGAF
jgi:hypothetical protein